MRKETGGCFLRFFKNNNPKDTHDRISVRIWPDFIFYASRLIDFNFILYYDPSTICCGTIFTGHILLYFHFTKEISFVKIFQNLDSLIEKRYEA